MGVSPLSLFVRGALQPTGRIERSADPEKTYSPHVAAAVHASLGESCVPWMAAGGLLPHCTGAVARRVQLEG